MIQVSATITIISWLQSDPQAFSSKKRIGYLSVWRAINYYTVSHLKATQVQLCAPLSWVFLVAFLPANRRWTALRGITDDLPVEGELDRGRLEQSTGRRNQNGGREDYGTGSAACPEGSHDTVMVVAHARLARMHYLKFHLNWTNCFLLQDIFMLYFSFSLCKCA